MASISELSFKIMGAKKKYINLKAMEIRRA